MRSSLLGLVAVLLLGACGGASNSPSTSSSSAAPEKTSLKIGVGGQSQIIYLPLTLADQLGYFKDEGFTVEIDDLAGGSQALTAMLGGSVDLVTGFYEHTIRTQAQGKFIQMFALFDDYPGLVMMVGKQHQDQVKSIKDLVGHPVGVTAPGSSTDEMVKYLLKKAGLATDAIPVVQIGSGSTAVAAIESGQVWAGVTVEPTASQLERSGQAKPLYDTRTAAGTKDVFGGSWPAGGFYAPTAFIKANPRTTQALARVAVKTLKYIHSHSADDIAAHLPASFYPGGDKATFVQVLQASLGMFSPDGTMPGDGPPVVFDTVKTADPKTDWSAVDLKKTYDNSWVAKAR